MLFYCCKRISVAYIIFPYGCPYKRKTTLRLNLSRERTCGGNNESAVQFRANRGSGEPRSIGREVFAKVLVLPGEDHFLCEIVKVGAPPFYIYILRRDIAKVA